MKFFLLICIFLLVSSCANKDYEKPDVNTTFDDSTIDTESSVDGNIEKESKEKITDLADEDRKEEENKNTYTQLFCSLYEHWWEFFNDEKLNFLIRNSLVNNKDIKKYIAKFEEAIAIAGIAKSQLYPELNLVAGGSTAKNATTTGAFGTTGISAGLMASWEIDLWGQLREASNATQSEVKATKLLLDTIALSVSNAVANTYFQLISIQEKMNVLKELEQMLQTNYEYEEVKYKSGLTNNNNLNNIKNEMLSIKIQLPQLEQANYNTKLALQLLVGVIDNIDIKGDFSFLNDRNLDNVYLPELPKEVDSRLLLNRPDIISAEQNIVSANHNINSARDMYFPKIYLTASGGFNRNNDTDGKFYSVNLYLFQPIFNRKAIASQVEKNEAMHKYAIAHYEYTVGKAINEGITAILDLDNFDKQYLSIKDMSDQLKKTYDNTNNSYKKGISSKYDLIKSNVDYTQAQMNLIDVKYKQIIARTNFYKVFAGEYKYGNI